jgi:polar amino acid transport system substrate-binding protein
LTTAYNVESNQITIEVHDQGHGIPQKVLQRIRDPFFTTKRQSGGTGLGLAIVDRIVDDHKGQLTFDSVVDQGTTVRVSLPVALTNDSVQEKTL